MSACLHVYKYITCVSDEKRGQKTASDSPELVLQVIMPPCGCWEPNLDPMKGQ